MMLKVDSTFLKLNPSNQALVYHTQSLCCALQPSYDQGQWPCVSFGVLRHLKSLAKHDACQSLCGTEHAKKQASLIKQCVFVYLCGPCTACHVSHAGRPRTLFIKVTKDSAQVWKGFQQALLEGLWSQARYWYWQASKG